MIESSSERHYRIWDDLNKTQKRACISVLVFSFLATIILLKSPETLRRIASTNQEIETKDSQIRANEELKGTLEEYRARMQDISSFIEGKPWAPILARLIDDLSRTGGRDEKRRLANQAIDDIASLVDRGIFVPLTDLEGQQLAFPTLSQAYGDFRSYVSNWRQEGLESNWYQTIQLKLTKMDRLDAGLTMNVKRLSDAIAAQQTEIAGRISTLARERTDLEARKVSFEKQIEQLDDQLDTILPGVLRGFVQTAALIRYFPLVVTVLFFYVMGSAASLTWHYFRSREVAGPDAGAQHEHSSIWTLSRRTGIGRVGTISLYALFTLGMASMCAIGLWLSDLSFSSRGLQKTGRIVLLATLALWTVGIGGFLVMLRRVGKPRPLGDVHKRGA